MAVAVDGDVVVEPAQGGEVVGVGVATLRRRRDVMCLEAVSGGAARNGAGAAVAV